MFRTCSTLFYHSGHDLSIGLFSLTQVFSYVLLKTQYLQSGMSTFAKQTKQNVGACEAAFSALFTYFAYPHCFCMRVIFSVLLISQCVRSRFFRTFFYKRKMPKKTFEVASPPRSSPLYCAPQNIRAIRVAILLRYLPEMKFAGTWCRLSVIMQRLLRNGG